MVLANTTLVRVSNRDCFGYFANGYFANGTGTDSRWNNVFRWRKPNRSQSHLLRKTYEIQAREVYRS